MSIPTIIVVDDHQIFRKGIVSLLSNENIGTIVGEASNGQEFLVLLAQNGIPDLVLMDIDMPKMNGEEATRLAVEKYPNIKIIALSMFGDEGHYYKMVNAGVKGFLLKNSDLSELECAITTVAGGETYFSNELLRKIISNHKFNSATPPKAESTLITGREQEVLLLICAGFTNEEIAEKLCISPTTVKGHRTHLLEKTECKNTASLIMYAIKHKMVDVG
jgi:DNA-binding NarL/FixJ family response regulator